MDAKTCSLCGGEKPLSEYGRRPEGRGFRSRCRGCEAAEERRRRAENRDEYRRRAKERRQNGGAERERTAKQRRKATDFFGYHAQFARRFNKNITADDLRLMWDRQSGRCGLTGVPMEACAGHVSIDHIMPQARGGSHDIENLRWVTRDANLAKRDLTDAEFYELCSNVAEWIGRRIMEYGA